jgi:aryl-alcohol dehydrogenase-like predicted oxidoreductase
MTLTAGLGEVATGPSGYTRAIGPSALSVFPIAISGNVFGWTMDVSTTDAILDEFTALGGNLIDTADSYTSGRSEIMIGNWMRAKRNRSDLVLATKIGKSADNPGLASRAVSAAVDASLHRLQTDHIDLLYLHIDDESVPFDETLLAVDELILAGKVRYFGAADHTANRLIEARIAAAQLGVAHLVALQNEYNLVSRSEYEGGLAHVSAMQNLGVMPRFALASGFLTGKYRSRSDVARSERGGEVVKYLTKRGTRVIAALDEVAFVHDASIATIALAWLLSRPNVVAPVVSASRPEQVRELTAAVGIQLTRHQLSDLDRASA